MLWTLGTARLACVLAGVGLVATRLGLVLHELAGHGGVATACGGSIKHVELFWFAGGWISYDLPEVSVGQRVAISMGGIALELVIATTIWFVLARRQSFAAKLARGCGAAIAIHAAWYLAVGTYHGFGDGMIVRWLAGDWRYPIAIAAGAVVLAFGFFGARMIYPVLAATLPSRPLAGVLVAMLVAGGLQFGLAFGEMATRPDQNYERMMTPQRVREAQIELEHWERMQRERGVDVDAEARRARERALAEKHRELPFAYILGAFAIAALAAGIWRSRAVEPITIPPRLVMTIGAVAVGSVALVIAIDAAFA